MTGDQGQQSAGQEQAPSIVQYIVIRTDLKWGQGATIAQACHASLAAVAETMDSEHTRAYLRDLKNMHKVILRADSADDLTNVAGKLKESQVAHHLWVEQPENVPSCLACSPQPKNLVQAVFRHLKLLR